MMTPDYEKMASLLGAGNIFNTVSELHGVISGQVCAGAKIIKADATRKLMGLDEPFDSIIEQLVDRLSKNVDEQLDSGEFTFHLLLPDDSEEINIRLYALSQWCEGFNVGFGGAFARPDQSILEETREVLKDFAAIAEIEDNPDDADGEQNEESYMEIVEYVRMAVATVYMQNAGEATITPQPYNQPSKGNIH